MYLEILCFIENRSYKDDHFVAINSKLTNTAQQRGRGGVISYGIYIGGM